MLSFIIVIDDFFFLFLMNVIWFFYYYIYVDFGNIFEFFLFELVFLVKLMVFKFIFWKKGVIYVIVMMDLDVLLCDDLKWFEFCYWIVIGVLILFGISFIFFDEIMGYKFLLLFEKIGKYWYVLLVFVFVNGIIEKLYLLWLSVRKYWGYDVGNDGDKDMKGVREWVVENGFVFVGELFF